jgi:CheY-like chemotaxis protein
MGQQGKIIAPSEPAEKSKQLCKDWPIARPIHPDNVCSAHSATSRAPPLDRPDVIRWEPNVDSVPLLPPNAMETKPTVLIVEDEFLLRWAAAEFLRERGYTVIEATNVRDAISIFDSGTHVDIVFSDVHMPGELTGHALAEWLDLNHPNVALLLTSASTTEADKVSTGKKRRFIAKPYELGEVSVQLASMSTDR